MNLLKDESVLTYALANFCSIHMGRDSDGPGIPVETSEIALAETHSSKGIDGMLSLPGFNRRDLKFETDAKVFAAADPDNNGILDKNQFLDAGHDGTIDAEELKSSGGLSLMLLLK